MACIMHEINGACELVHDCIIWCVVTHWLQTGGIGGYLTVENKIMTSLEEQLGTKTWRVDCLKLNTKMYIQNNQNLLVFLCLSVFTACSITPGFWNGIAWHGIETSDRYTFLALPNLHKGPHNSLDFKMQLWHHMWYLFKILNFWRYNGGHIN